MSATRCAGSCAPGAQLTQKLNRDPTNDEIAAEVGITAEQGRRAARARRAPGLARDPGRRRREPVRRPDRGPQLRLARRGRPPRRYRASELDAALDALEPRMRHVDRAPLRPRRATPRRRSRSSGANSGSRASGSASSRTRRCASCAASRLRSSSTSRSERRGRGRGAEAQEDHGASPGRSPWQAFCAKRKWGELRSIPRGTSPMLPPEMTGSGKLGTPCARMQAE